MKEVYLTFDIETIVSKLSKSKNTLTNVFLSAIFIAEELKKRNLKGTFYISLSSKQNKIEQSKYIETIKWLIKILKLYENVKIEPHIHSLNLPVSFETNNDSFNFYNRKQQVELLQYSIDFFSKLGVNVNSFRPGGHKKNEFYYTSLKDSNIKNSSLLDKEIINIDLINNSIVNSKPYFIDGVKEYPVTSVKIKSIKGNEEIVNLSPDFFTLESLEKYFNSMDYLNINFHSFSIYSNRILRENHKNLYSNNLKYFFIEKPITYILKFLGIQTFKTNTILKKELLKWLDYFQSNNYKSKFIGE